MEPRTGRNWRAATWLAWSAWVLTALAVAFTLFFDSLNVSSGLRNTVPASVLILAFSTTGALVASRLTTARRYGPSLPPGCPWRWASLS